MDEINNLTISKEVNCGKWDWTNHQSNIERLHGWWIHGIGSLIVGLIGIVLNIIFIRVLTCPEFRNILFNKLILCLALSDIVFLFCSGYDSLRLNLLHFDHCSVHGYLQLIVYPIRKISMCFSTYMTVILSFERFLAVTNPIKHRNRDHIGSSWLGRFLTYVSPAFIVSFLLYGTPLFFAFKMEDVEGRRFGNDGSSNSTYEAAAMDNRTCLSVWWRLDKNYILMFNNVGTFIITGMIPFLLLVIFNFKIYLSIRHASKQIESLNIRRSSTFRGNVNVNNQQIEEKKNEILQSMVLFGIFILFFVCHLLRVVLNLEEMIYFDELNKLEVIENQFGIECIKVQFWTAIASDISHLLLQVGSSSNFFIYGYLSKKFKAAIKRKIFRCKMFRDSEAKATQELIQRKNTLCLTELTRDQEKDFTSLD